MTISSSSSSCSLEKICPFVLVYWCKAEKIIKKSLANFTFTAAVFVSPYTGGAKVNNQLHLGTSHKSQVGICYPFFQLKSLLRFSKFFFFFINDNTQLQYWNTIQMVLDSCITRVISIVIQFHSQSILKNTKLEKISLICSHAKGLNFFSLNYYWCEKRLFFPSKKEK